MLNLLPKDQSFYDQLESLSDQVVTGAAELRRLMQEFPAEARERAKALEARDKSMERLVQAALERLDAAFITPLDREDILHLITDMHRVVRAVSALAQRIILYGLDNVDPKLTAQADALARLEHCLHELLRQLRHNPRLATLHGPLDQIRRLRQTAEDIQRDFLGEPLRVVVDAAGYRERRAVALRAAADQAAEAAVHDRRPVTLEAMSAQERKVVHEHLKARHDVETYSEGQEPDRRLVVAPLVE